MTKESAGILLFRRASGKLEVLLVHPGGPFWAKQDEHAWSIPKGEIAVGEAPIEAAKREVAEETGIVVTGELVPLGVVKQTGGKTVHAWAAEQDADVSAIRSNTFELEWPPRSGQLCRFPEVDRAEWFPLDIARAKLNQGQVELLGRLAGAGTKW
jgi:predicted NUDIX family NTP pyrophosphohydrolase